MVRQFYFKLNRVQLILFSEDSVGEPSLPPEMVEEGTKIVEDMLRTWASRVSEQDDDDVLMEDVEDSSTTQLEELKRCVEQFRPQIEGNPWVQHVLASL